MRKVIAVDPSLCCGCRTCELVCSLHLVGEFRPSASGIRRHTLNDDLAFVPVSCLHCTEPMCLDVCPVGAISRDSSGIVRLDRSACVGCLICHLACPIGALAVADGKTVKCDLCGGEPLCVKRCPRDALSVIDATELGEARGRSLAATLREVTGPVVPGAGREGTTRS